MSSCYRMSTRKGMLNVFQREAGAFKYTKNTIAMINIGRKKRFSIM